VLPLLDAVRDADVVFLALPSQHAIEVAELLFKDATAPPQVLVDLTNPVGWDHGPFYMPPPEGSVPLALLARMPKLRVVKGFNTLALEQFVDPGFSGAALASSEDSPAAPRGECSVCSDDAEAKAATMEIARDLGFHPVDLGSILESCESEKLAIEKWIAFRSSQRTSAPRLLKRRQGSDDSMSRIDSVDSCDANVVKRLEIL
jgi:predicted dinucleotide-binding enzyme